MSELFEMPESKSPRLKWMERHHLTVIHRPGALISKAYAAKHGMATVAYGETPEEAITNAAVKLKIRLWNAP